MGMGTSAERMGLAVAALAVLAAGYAPADASERRKEHVYMQINAGGAAIGDLNFDDDVSDLELTTSDGAAGFNSPWAAVEMGYALYNNFRVGVHVGYGRTDVEALHITGGTIPVDGRTQIISFGLNSYYDFETETPVLPYLGLGLGGLHASTQYDSALLTGGQRDVDGTGFAAQALAGFAVPVTDAVDLTFGYRYFYAPDITAENQDLALDGRLKIGGHVAEIGLRFAP